MKNKLNNFLAIVIMLTFLISFTSSLDIAGDVYFDVNKTEGQTQYINFLITNPESFSFFAVDLEDNDYLDMEPIVEIASGQTYNVTAEVIADQPFSGSLKVIGFYEAQIGASNETYNVDIDYNTGLSLCDLTLIKGDSITWENQVNGEVTIRNADTQQNVAGILEGENYTTTFELPEVFRYYVLRRGFIFTNTCTITVLDDTGLINNPDYNTQLNLNVDYFYQNTEVSLDVLTTSYNMSFASTQDGIISITNTGNQTAKDVHLEGDWFRFGANDFDLEVGYTRNVPYTIDPIVQSSNDTDKTYTKPIRVSGNFPTQEENFTIYIQYAEIVNNLPENTSNLDEQLSIYLDFLEAVCNSYPEKTVCKAFNERVVYEFVNDTSFNVTLTQEQVFEIFDMMFEFIDDFEQFQNLMKEQSLNYTRTFTNISTTQGSIQQEVSGINKNVENANSLQLFYTVAGLFVVVVGILGYLILRKMRIDKRNRAEKYY